MRETGPARKELTGDAAAPYMGAARTVLGQLKNDMAFNDLAQGQRTRQLPDGVVIEVESRYGQDTIRIVAPETPPPVLVEEVIERKAGIKTEGEEVIETDGSAPYLWVGARIVGGGNDVLGAAFSPDGTGRYVKLHLCVWEGDSDSANGDGWTIISNRNVWGYDGSRSNYPLGPNKTMPASDPGLPYTEKHHCVCVDDQFPDWLPNVASGLGTSAATLRNATYAPGTTDKFDVVIFCDPDDRAGFDKLGTGGWAKGKPSGQFHVKVMATADDCINFTPVQVELKIIAARPGTSGNASKTARFTISEFTNYRFGVLPYGWFSADGARGPTDCVAQNDHGSNPHGPHWFPGGAAISLPAPQLDVPKSQYLRTSLAWNDKLHIPPVGFSPGGFPARDDRCRMCTTKHFGFGGEWVSWDAYAPDGTIWPDTIPPTKPYGYHRSNAVGFGDVVFRGGVVVSTMNNIYQVMGITSLPMWNDTLNPGWNTAASGFTTPQDIEVLVEGNVFQAPLSPQTHDFGPISGGNSACAFLMSWYWDAEGKFHMERIGDFFPWSSMGGEPPGRPDDIQYRIPYPYGNFDGRGNELNQYVKEWRRFNNLSGYDGRDEVGIGYGWPDPAEPTKPPPGTV